VKYRFTFKYLAGLPVLRYLYAPDDATALTVALHYLTSRGKAPHIWMLERDGKRIAGVWDE
jgi:hypothetical protein